MVFTHFVIMLANYGTHCQIVFVSSTSIAAFKAALESLDLDKECCSFCDEYKAVSFRKILEQSQSAVERG